MKRLISIAVFSTLIAFNTEATAECSDIIAMSKVVSETVQDSSQIDSYARAFCSEYASSKGSTTSTSFGLAYKVLSASFGQSSANMEQVASRYCDATRQDSAKTDAYRQYVETIAPGAFTAYSRCVELKGSGLVISVDKNSILPTYFAVSVSFSSNDSLATQIVDHATSPDVNCIWNNGSGTKTTIKSNSSDVLTCSRANATAKSAIHVVALSKPNSQLSFAWDRYQNDLPVDTLKQLTQQVSTATAALTQVTKATRSSVVAFALPSCPDGWVDYQPAYGRFVRGIDRSGTKIDPDGMRSVGSVQADAFARHKHSRPNDVYDAGGVTVGSVNSGTGLGYGYGSGMMTGESGTADETRPRNISLLYCIPK